MLLLCFTRVLAIVSLAAFVVLTLCALPDPSECIASIVRFQRDSLLALHASFTLAALVASVHFARRHIVLALAFIAVAHGSASRGLERVELYAPAERVHATHVHGPWGLLRTQAGDGTAVLAGLRFAR